MNIRIDPPTYQAGIVSGQSQQSSITVSFSEVFENVQKQKEVTQEQADYFQRKYMSDRYLTPQDAANMIAELDKIVELDEDMVDALPTVAQSAGQDGRAWNLNAYLKYTDLLRSVSVDVSDAQPLAVSPNLMESLLHHSNYGWANEWGQMGMIADTGMVVQLGPGINLESKGDRQLSEQEIAAMKEKYMADGSFSAADARYFIGELCHAGAIDGQLAWDLIMGETFTRDITQPRQASLFADEERWDLDALLEYLWQKHLDFKVKADAETDMSLWEQYKRASEQREKLHGIFEMMMGA